MVAPCAPGRTAVNPEVTAKAVRRQFTAAYKRRVLEESPLSCAVRDSIRRT